MNLFLDLEIMFNESFIIFLGFPLYFWFDILVERLLLLHCGESAAPSALDLVLFFLKMLDEVASPLKNWLPICPFCLVEELLLSYCF